MEDHFTAKEMETIKLIHDFRKYFGYGEMNIQFHNHDVSDCKIVLNTKPKGDLTNIDFVDKLISILAIEKSREEKKQ
jgi:hypothetical protein